MLAVKWLLVLVLVLVFVLVLVLVLILALLALQFLLDSIVSVNTVIV